MAKRCSWLILFTLIPFFCNDAEAQSFGGVGQLGRGGVGSPGLTGSRSPGVAALRSGLGSINNPVANPSPSLTPYRVLNPRGSLGAGDVFNPYPSLFRPGWSDSYVGRQTFANRYEVASGRHQQIHRMSRYDGARAVIGNARVLAAETSGMPKANALPLNEVRQLGDLLVQAPYADVKERIQKVLKQWDEFAASEQNSQIASLPSFQSIRMLLAEYELPPSERQWKVLLGYSEELQEQLARYQHADQWKTYLSLPSPKKGSGAAKNAKPSLQSLQELKKRFDKVADTEKYASLANLPAFVDTREQLNVVIAFAEAVAG